MRVSPESILIAQATRRSKMYRHVYRHVYRHMYRHVHKHVWTCIDIRHAYRHYLYGDVYRRMYNHRYYTYVNRHVYRHVYRQTCVYTCVSSNTSLRAPVLILYGMLHAMLQWLGAGCYLAVDKSSVDDRGADIGPVDLLLVRWAGHVRRHVAVTNL